jgi:hypothetical protein
MIENSQGIKTTVSAMRECIEIYIDILYHYT